MSSRTAGWNLSPYLLDIYVRLLDTIVPTFLSLCNVNCLLVVCQKCCTQVANQIMNAAPNSALLSIQEPPADAQRRGRVGSAHMILPNILSTSEDFQLRGFVNFWGLV